MSEEPQAHAEDDLVYMISGEDKNGDTLIFVTSDIARAAARNEVMLADFRNVKANWLDPR